IDKYVTPVLCAVGVTGNTVSLAVWLQRRMRQSSGYYMVTLALNDLIFLALLVVFELHVVWGVRTLNHPVICELYPVVYLATQFLSTFLVLGFTVERYISVCHPFKRDKYCTVRKAKLAIASMTLFVFLLTAPYGYFFTIDDTGADLECQVRESIREGQFESIYNRYTLSVDMLSFLVVPVIVLTFNILVIIELRRLSRLEQAQLHGSPQRTAANTAMLLTVSFYLILTTLPVSITYAFQGSAALEPEEIPTADSQALQLHRTYDFVLKIVKEYGITHYVFNFFIYLITGRMFRQELKRIFLQPFRKLSSS
ncbi:unnamed protein product, partial [Lymnaea stagnalis]